MRGKIVLTAFGAAGLLFLILLACALGQAYRARAMANAFLSDVRELRVGQSTYDDVLRIRTNYKNRSSVEASECDQNLCTLDFSFDNRWLYHFGLVRGSRFTGSLRVNKGVLVRVRLSLLSDPRNDAMTEEVPAAPDLSAYEVGGKKLNSGQGYSYVWAQITSAASTDERQRAYAFNLACLTKWGGCKDSNELLPILKDPQ
jgi:hypothetical protein